MLRHKGTSGIIKAGVKELKWPTQSPDLNPTEYLWDGIFRFCRHRAIFVDFDKCSGSRSNQNSDRFSLKILLFTSMSPRGFATQAHFFVSSNHKSQFQSKFQ